MNHDIETQLKNAGETVHLSTDEKALHRAKLQTFMRTSAAPIVSPFYTYLFAPARYAFVALLIVAASGTGVAFAANDAAPGSALYLVRVRVTEPARLAFTLNSEARADLEVALVHQRLQEFSVASVHGDLDATELALVTDTLAKNIDEVQQNVSELQENEETDTAFETATDLQSVLSAHSKILTKLKPAYAAKGGDIARVSASVAEELDETEALVDSTENDVDDTTTASLEAPAEDQQGDTLAAFTDLKAKVEAALASFDESDKKSLDASLAAIDRLLAQAEEKDAMGEVKASYLLYAEAEQRITELTTTIDADQELGVDVIED